MLVTGFPGDPPLKTGVTYIDIGTGQCCALGILLALYDREKTGLGQEIDVSLFDYAFFATQALGVLLLYQVYGELRTQVGNRGFHSYIGCLRAKDGWVTIAPATNHIWERFTKAIGRREMSKDPRFRNDMDRFRNADAIEPAVSEWVSQRTVEEVMSAMDEAKVPSSPVNMVDKLIDDPQVRARQMIVSLDHPELGELPLPGIPINLSRTPGEIRSRAPKVGENNKEVFMDLLGLSREEYERIKSENVIG
jgi:CoA:oxalate CoA-transferase